MNINIRSILVYFRQIALMLLFLVFSALSFSGTAAGSVSSTPEYVAPVAEDFSSLPWSESFDKLHSKFSREYGFTEWKKIDWTALYKRIKPLVERAEASNDFTAYYLAMREYVNSIPDGHVRMSSIRDIDDKYIGGGFGFSATKLSDGRVIASWVDETSAVYAQGMRAGAELIEWNGRPVKDVLNEVSTIFGPNSATAEVLANQQVHYLTRAPVNTRLSLLFSNITGGTAKASVSAYDDKGKSLVKTYPSTVVSDGLRDWILEVENPGKKPESMVERRLLEGNIGYIKIWGEIDVDLKETGTAPSTLGLFKSALAEFNKLKVRGLILDIRNNVGGLDSMSAEILGLFSREKALYEYASFYNSATGTFQILPDDLSDLNNPDYALYIEPDEPFFGGPVAALINSKCVSSGEGLAMGIKDLPRGETVGFYGTNGSFGMAGGGAKIPGNIVVHWPYGQSLDKDKEVQIDSRDGIGGVSPSIRTPMTLENALRAARGEDVELEHAIKVINSCAAE